jgi:hypothetical protein
VAAQRRRQLKQRALAGNASRPVGGDGIAVVVALRRRFCCCVGAAAAAVTDAVTDAVTPRVDLRRRLVASAGRLSCNAIWSPSLVG